MSAEQNLWKRVEGRSANDIVYYSVLGLLPDANGMDALRQLFPDGEANDLSFCLFSTSGVHGTYCTVEDVEQGECKDVTFVVIQPRIVCMRYGNVKPRSPDDFAFLKKLRASSHRAVVSIGGCDER